MQLFEKAYSLNQFRNEHYYKLNQLKTFWNIVVQNTVAIKNIKPVQSCEIEFIFHFQNKTRRDLDNLSATIKFILDGLVSAKIIKDDHSEIVKKITITKGYLSKNMIEVIIIGEVDAK
jgi:Holliday junction resolvase RusA-like endonuclease